MRTTIRRRQTRSQLAKRLRAEESSFFVLSLEEVSEIAAFFYDDSKTMEAFLIAVSNDAKLVCGLAPLENEILLRSRSRVVWNHGVTPGHDYERRVRFVEGLALARQNSSFDLDSIFPHGSMHWAHSSHLEADETVALVSIRPRSRRLLFAISRAEQNACDADCWCTRLTCTTVHVFLPRPLKLLVVGALDGDSWIGPLDNSAVGVFETSSKSKTLQVSRALDIPPHTLGHLLRALILSANLCLCGKSTCEDVEYVAGRSPKEPNTDFFTTFPKASRPPGDVNFALQNFAINPDHRHCVSSPRRLLSHLLPEISRRLAPLHRDSNNADLKSFRYALRGFEKSVNMPTHLVLRRQLEDCGCHNFFTEEL